MLGPPLEQKGPPICFRTQCVCLIVCVICCFEWGHRKPTPWQKPPKYTSHYYKVQPNFSSLEFPNQKQILSLNPKILLNHLRKGEITVMDKGRVSRLNQTMRGWSTYGGSAERAYNVLFPHENTELEKVEKVMRKRFPAKLLSKDVWKKEIGK